MSWASKTWKKLKKHVNRAVGTALLPAGMLVGMAKHGGDLSAAADDAYNLFSKGSEGAPEQEQAPDVTGGLAAAIDEEESRRRKKRGFAANVLTDEFRFGGGL